ncbi:hypothetical protein HPE56_06875 [Maribacter sp. ANRC-HE7]|uniref:Uncharacterized protein n=1 Tax=Maribacter aquimaris TaxID=2737171 RepID=A0ABR7UY35_9FLAO|nr:hypothetical protein [Maribacter aquimaris]MBD0777509.1 hypothetical protein [Maribacter aquimaris]
MFKNEMTKAKNNNYLSAEIGDAKKGKPWAIGVSLKIEVYETYHIQRIGPSDTLYSVSHKTLVSFGLSGFKAAEEKVNWTNGVTKTELV